MADVCDKKFLLFFCPKTKDLQVIVNVPKNVLRIYYNNYLGWQLIYAIELQNCPMFLFSAVSYWDFIVV